MTGQAVVKWGAILSANARACAARLVLGLFCLGFYHGPVLAKPVESSIVIDVGSGAVLSATNADAATYPASLTKMMTLYLLFEALDKGSIALDDAIVFSKYAATRPATNLAVDPGDTIRVETAILALVVRSANDVAAAIGEKLAGTESAFARKMTEKARALGMVSTTFRNASGLPDPKQRTTARDMAILGLALLRDYPEYYDYFSTSKFTYRGVTYTGHNRLLKKFAGADGIKTGYIRASGFNLVSSAERDGRRLVGVVLGGSSPSTRDRWMARLLEAAFLEPSGKKTLTIAAAPEPDPAGKVVAALAVTEDDPVADLLASAGIIEVAPKLRPESGQGVALAQKPDAQETVNVWNATEGDFGIQVGAFAKQAAARTAANRATQAVPELLGEARIVVDTQRTENGGVLYRARVIGLSKPTAEEACRNLQESRTDCLVLKTGSNLAMGG